MGINSTSSAVARQEFGRLVERGVFQPVRRFINADPDDRMQDALGMVYEMYEAKAERGEKMDPALLTHAVKLRAVDLSRHLVRGTHSIKDPLEPRAYHSGRVELLHLDGLPDEDGHFEDEGDRALELGHLELLAASPEAVMTSAIDLTEWLETLDAGDLQLLVLRQQGFTIEEISTAVGLSMSAVFHRLRRLGRELADRAGLPVVKKPRKPRAAKSAAPALDS
jgi:DNA-directed RNA polymerase specialized sigma24 family protein